MRMWASVLVGARVSMWVRMWVRVRVRVRMTMRVRARVRVRVRVRVRPYLALRDGPGGCVHVGRDGAGVGEGRGEGGHLRHVEGVGRPHGERGEQRVSVEEIEQVAEGGGGQRLRLRWSGFGLGLGRQRLRVCWLGLGRVRAR